MAESLINPFGEDADDFEIEYLIERNLNVSSRAIVLNRFWHLAFRKIVSCSPYSSPDILSCITDNFKCGEQTKASIVVARSHLRHLCTMPKSSQIKECICARVAVKRAACNVLMHEACHKEFRLWNPTGLGRKCVLVVLIHIAHSHPRTFVVICTVNPKTSASFIWFCLAGIRLSVVWLNLWDSYRIA